VSVVTGYVSGEGEAQIADSLGVPVVDPHHSGRREVVAGFLQRFTNHRIYQRLVWFHMTGRLVDDQFIGGQLLDQ